MREGREELTGHGPQLKASALPDEVGHLLELWDVILAERWPEGSREEIEC